MNNGLPGPSTTDTITGGKTLELSEYDKVRKSHKAITDGTEIKINARSLSSELCCPICLDLLKNTMTTKECLHRFCDECITTALMRGNKECPTCRKKIVSKRSLRPDPNFDNIINAIWPDRRLYEEMQEESMRLFNEQNNVKALQKSIEDGMKAQAANRRQRVQGSYDYEKKRRRPKFAGDASQGSGQTTTSNAICGGDASGAVDSSADNDGTTDASAPNVDGSSAGGAAAATGRRTTRCRSTSTEASNETETALLSEEGSSVDEDDDDESTNSHVEESSDDEGASNTAMEVDEPTASRLTASHSSGGSSSLARHCRRHHNAKPARGRKVNGGGVSTSSAMNASAGGSRNQSGVKPPSSQSTLNDKMNKWLSNNQDHCSSPLLPPEDDDASPSALLHFSPSAVTALLREIDQKHDGIEVELTPAKSLLKRKAIAVSQQQLLSSRFVRAPPETTMEHFAEYLLQTSLEDSSAADREEAGSASNSGSSSATADQNQTTPAATTSKSAHSPSPSSSSNRRGGIRPEYFYIVDYNNQIRKMFLHDPLYIAFFTSTLSVGTSGGVESGRDAAASPPPSQNQSKNHLQIFYDVAPPDVNSCGRLINEIIGHMSSGRLKSTSMPHTSFEKSDTKPGISKEEID